MQGRMFKDFKVYLWLLKLGALVNFYFLWQSLVPPMNVAQVGLLYPAQILFIVSAYRCLFPVRYKDNTVFHDSVFSSIFLTRLLATFSEVALIYQFAYLLRILNVAQVGWINVLSWGMVLQVVISQFFVWGNCAYGQAEVIFLRRTGLGNHIRRQYHRESLSVYDRRGPERGAGITALLEPDIWRVLPALAVPASTFPFRRRRSARKGNGYPGKSNLERA